MSAGRGQPREVVHAQGMAARDFHGACACGAVRFLVTADPDTATRCICARCRGMGLRIVTADGAGFRLLTGRDDLTEPMSDARTPHHFFCARCGEAAFGYPLGPAGALVTVNLALLERGDPADVSGDVSGDGPVPDARSGGQP